MPWLLARCLCVFLNIVNRPLGVGGRRDVRPLGHRAVAVIIRNLTGRCRGLFFVAAGYEHVEVRGTIEQLLVSPLSAVDLMLGKTIPVAGVAMIQITIVTTVALFWFDIPFRGEWATLALAAALFILAGLSFGLLISTISSTQQEAFLAMFLFVLPSVILSGFLYPVETMPWIFQQLTLANPLRHFLEIVRGVFLKGAGVEELAVQFLVLAAMAMTGLAVATRRFRRTL